MEKKKPGLFEKNGPKACDDEEEQEQPGYAVPALRRKMMKRAPKK